MNKSGAKLAGYLGGRLTPWLDGRWLSSQENGSTLNRKDLAFARLGFLAQKSKLERSLVLVG